LDKSTEELLTKISRLSNETTSGNYPTGELRWLEKEGPDDYERVVETISSETKQRFGEYLFSITK
jgi:hypothetical protein